MMIILYYLLLCLSSKLTFNIATENSFKVNLKEMEYLCPVKCQENDHVKCCCACEISQSELYSNITIIPLFVEQLDVTGRISTLFDPYENNVSETNFEFVYQDGFLRSYPVNMCIYNIVAIDLANNKFVEVGDVSCLVDLDTLILKYNLITYVSNRTFGGLKKLRKVDLSYNRLKFLDNNLFASNTVFFADFSGNYFKEIDVSNFLHDVTCNFNFENNNDHMTITNHDNIQLGSEVTEFCGHLNFDNNSLSINPILLVSDKIDPNEIVKYTSGGSLALGGSMYVCDCELAELIQLEYPDFKRLASKELHQSRCQSPEKLKNKDIYEVWENKTLHDEMICDLTIPEGCTSFQIRDTMSYGCSIDPYISGCNFLCPTKSDGCECRCTSQPSKKRLIVDCSNQNCTDLPRVIPKSKYKVTLIMLNNEIKTVNCKYYYENISVLDLRGNFVKYLSDDIGKMTSATEVRLDDHELVTLPKAIQNLQPNVFHFGLKGIPCICDHIWIGEWQKYRPSNTKNFDKLYCLNNYITIEEYIEEAECNIESFELTTWISFSIIITAILGFLTLVYYFRFEILILRQRLKSPRKPFSPNEIDCYIAYDGENEDVRTFVFDLDCFLRKREFSTYITCRDAELGETRENNILIHVTKCKYVIIVQSSNMYTKNNIHHALYRQEYRLAWNRFMQGYLNNILVIDFDNEGPGLYFHKKTIALYRLGMGLSVSNRKISLYEKILETFSKPVHSKQVLRNGWMKTKRKYECENKVNL